jgi:hypothetical protein
MLRTHGHEERHTRLHRPSPALSLLGRLLWVGPSTLRYRSVSQLVRICMFGRWALWEPCPRLFVVVRCGSLELLGWPRLAGEHPLVCTADPF